jgi:heme A synthase
MTDRGILFLFSLLTVVVSVAASGWLVVSGQAATVDGLFLLLTCLLVALAFALYLMFMINRAKESLQPAAQPAKPAAPAAKPAPKPATSSHPVETS